MATIKNITEDFIISSAPNSTAVANARKISRTGGFYSLKKTADDTLIYGECKGSSAKPYYTSADFMGETPVFRCSCPSRQFPCKHSIAIMFDWLAGKDFETGEVPDDIVSKRKKIEDKAKKAESGEAPKPKKPNKSAITKKLKKQREGLELAERFVNDILSRGVSSVNSASCSQYQALAKQLGDYYLPEPQAIMLEIISLSRNLSEKPDDKQLSDFTQLCVRLSSSVRKSMDYIDKKLESGEVMPENNILYEAMGNVWKLTQLKELGLCKQDSEILQLFFAVLEDRVHNMYIDTAYWIDLTDGEICKTENKRPFRAVDYIKEEDSFFGVYQIPELCLYPGGLNRRVRWDVANIRSRSQADLTKAVSFAEDSLAEAVKKAKNELKNTLSNPTVAMLIKYDSIEFAEDGHGVLKLGDETISLKASADYPDVINVLKILGCGKYNREGCAVMGELFYEFSDRKIYLCPLAIITPEQLIRLW
ncbi:MAG: hypothetical protein NC340_05560 [Ruminococcus flavefaciens]|nr:hypothetical protein [Ruminococcus flavefaciens]MCM1230511.1 hypothetical protein [Ruminococcus flavefaciens]